MQNCENPIPPLGAVSPFSIDEHGDRICMFGFSRGAYTARALAGMLHKVRDLPNPLQLVFDSHPCQVGLLPACNFQQVPFAYKMYTRADDIGWQQSNLFKRAFSIDVDIEFIGVWYDTLLFRRQNLHTIFRDTVASVGIVSRKLPFTTSNTIVRTFRHAVSLDERRAKFKANLWNRPNSVEQTLGFHNVENMAPNVLTPDPFPDTPSPTNKTRNPIIDEHAKQSVLERKYSLHSATPTSIEEVWFSGCHCGRCLHCMCARCRRG
jgi:uncharacterized protein (DUF2235 family)